MNFIWIWITFAKNEDFEVGLEANKLFNGFHFEFLFSLAEHMLFFASEKYPVEDSYSKYITEVVTVHILKQHLCLFEYYCHGWFSLDDK